jgi:hypothetical protein
MTIIDGTPANIPEVESVSFGNVGPKRVKTKEMEIEQFDPLRSQMALDRSQVMQPSWCQGHSCVGRYKGED